jgi:hypothetical protein
MMIRAVLSDLQGRLLQNGLERSESNFNMDSYPAGSEDRSFTFADISIVPSYHPGRQVLYSRIEISLQVLCNIFGEHNPSASASDGYLASLDTFELVESAVVAQEESRQNEDCKIVSASLRPFGGGRNAEFVLWVFRLNIECKRSIH